MDRPSRERGPSDLKRKGRVKGRNKKEFDNYKESNTTCIGPLVDCKYQPKLVDSDGSGINPCELRIQLQFIELN